MLLTYCIGQNDFPQMSQGKANPKQQTTQKQNNPKEANQKQKQNQPTKPTQKQPEGNI